jgi:quercetin dioxygenase-like cupin family protein
LPTGQFEKLSYVKPDHLASQGIATVFRVAKVSQTPVSAERSLDVHKRHSKGSGIDMSAIDLVDMSATLLDINPNRSVTARHRWPGPPERIDGMTVGIVTAEGDGPHGGERHPDGDEILYVISGELMLHADTMTEPVRIPAGYAGIVKRGEWHKVTAEMPTQMIHITPGPHGDARPK